jgi:hypothetical protein
MKDWTERAHGGSLETYRNTGPSSRTFAEFPFTKSWQEIAIHAQRLQGVSRVGLFGKGERSWLRFAYMGQSFGVQDGGHRLTLTVDDASCPEAILVAVQSHFEAFLSPWLQD